MTLRIQEPRVPQRPDAAALAGGLVPIAVPSPPPTSVIRNFLQKRGNSGWADSTFRWLMLLCALSIFAIVALIATELVSSSRLSLHKFGFGFFLRSAWDPVTNNFGALPFIYGTLASSILGLIIAVPLAVGVAVFITEMCPRLLRGPLSFLTELLAAIPSVVYGLWAIFVLVPLLRGYVNPVLIKILGWTGLFQTPDFGIGLFAAGVILAIMILPIISSLTREVMTAVPSAQREAVLALGATRWEMIRVGVLRNARIGIVGSIILGLGRALGETMAVAMVIGSNPTIHRNLLAPAATMASVIANEFAEAADDTYRSALVEIGLALFLVTIVVNILARLLVWGVTRGTPPRTA
ncbi:MAG TPA: phosphate ABC transporter permease subunit PstC [Acidobacteriaceae bacterium]|nr:phosphate ABC transporter permease subunit PstC [Acidobacteriaceae bacterium]